MAGELTNGPLVSKMQVEAGGTGVVAHTIQNLHLHLPLGPNVSNLDPFATVPPRPAGFISRPEVTEAIFGSLSTESTVGLTAIEGMGGIGKTVVANDLCHDPRVRALFKDGILWFTIEKQSGLTPEALTREMALHLNQEFRVYSRAAYRSLFRNKSILVVLDNVWTLDEIEPFLLDIGSSKLLYTTRNREIADSIGAKNHDVDLLSDLDARRFLAQRSNHPLPLPEPAAKEIISQCKGLVLGLAMIGAALKNKPVSYWTRIVKNLRKARLKETGVRVANYAHHTLWASIAASVEQLSPEDRRRYCDIAILLEDMPCSAVLLRQMWGGEMDEAEAAMGRFVDMSLASRDADGSIRLHNFQLDFVRGEYPQPAALPLVYSAILRSLHVIRADPGQFASQVVGRLLSHRGQTGIAELLERLAANAARPCLWPLRPVLEQAGSSTSRVLDENHAFIKGALSADGGRVVFISKNDNVCVWDMEGHTPPRVLQGQANWKTAVALSANGSRTVFGCHDGTLQVCDLEGDAPPRVLEGHTDPVTAVALSADGSRAVSGSRDRTLHIWDLDGDTPPRVLEGHTDWVTAVALSADGSRAVSGSSDGILHVWDLDGIKPPRVLKSHTDEVIAVALSADGTRAVSCSSDDEDEDPNVYVWDFKDDASPRILEGHTHSVTGVGLSGDGTRAVSASHDNTLRVWDLEHDSPPRVLKGHALSVTAVALSADGSRAVSGSYDSTVRVWDLAVSTPLHVERNEYDVISVALSVDAGRAVSCSDFDADVHVWDLMCDTSPSVLKGHTRSVVAVALSADGSRAVSGSLDKTVGVWDLERHSPPRVLEGHTDSVKAVVVSADGSRAVSASYEEVCLWDLNDLTSPLVLQDKTGSNKAIAFGVDGRRAVSASYEETIRVWDLYGSSLPNVLVGHIADGAIALSADGRRVVFSPEISVLGRSENKTLCVWDLDRSPPTVVLTGHTDHVRSVALCASGNWAVSSSNDKTLRVWDLTNGTCAAVFTCDAQVSSCSWVGQHIIAGDGAGGIHLFRWIE